MTDHQPHCPAAGIQGRLTAIYEALLAHFGHRHWWPGDTPFEVCVGAILTQNTAWSNVKRAIDNLKEAGALSVEGLQSLPERRIAELVRPSGYYNQKADRLRRFAGLLAKDYGGSLDRFFDRDAEALRRALLEFKGIGEETADSILLYAAGRPRFVVDAYTKRIFFRKAMLREKATYGEAQDLFEKYLPRDVDLYNDFHAQIVALGHHYCRPKPLCEDCPVRRL